MTYCLGIVTRHGVVMAADSRTNAGVDYISTYRKLFDFSLPGDRVLILCTSGNLSVTQGVITALGQDLKHQVDVNLHSVSSMSEVARYIGHKIRQVQERERPWLERDGIDFNCNILAGGQIRGEEPQLHLIYSQGNAIQAMPETPFLQIGETKYGKPILDRTLTYDTSIEAAATCALLSIDSTMKSNISVGPPINVVMYETNAFVVRHQLELRLGDAYLAKIRTSWEAALREAFSLMPPMEWDNVSVPVLLEDMLID
jgi:putative proteasome-type protease